MSQRFFLGGGNVILVVNVDCGLSGRTHTHTHITHVRKIQEGKRIVTFSLYIVKSSIRLSVCVYIMYYVTRMRDLKKIKFKESLPYEWRCRKYF